jgi:hypothetical protein
VIDKPLSPVELYLQEVTEIDPLREQAIQIINRLFRDRTFGSEQEQERVIKYVKDVLKTGSNPWKKLL